MTTNTTSSARLLLDNAGGITLQFGDYATTVWDGEEAARLLLDYLASGDTSGWDGHDDDAAGLNPSEDDVNYTVLSLLDIAATLDAEEEPQGWGNSGREMLSVLRDAELLAIVDEDGYGPAYGAGRNEEEAWADAQTWGVTDCDGLTVAQITPASWIRVKTGRPDAWTLAK